MDTHGENNFSTGTYYSKQIDGSFVWFKNTANITYVLNGGKVGTDSSTTTYVKSTPLSANGFNPNTNSQYYIEPTKNYYTFDGWYSDSACTDGKKVTEIFSDCTLYAKWNPISYTIDYQIQPAEGELPGNEKKQISGDEVYTLPTPINGDGYFFKGWSLTKDDSTNLITSISAANAKDGVITVYAIFDNTISYNLIFEGIPDNIPNKDSFANKTGITDLENIALPSTSDLDTNTEFYRVFVGWYTDEELQIPFDNNFVDLFEGKTTATLYAKWTYKAKVTIEYYEASKNTIDSITVYLANEQAKAITLADDYRFADDDNTTTSLTVNGTVVKSISADRKTATIKVNFTASETTQPTANIALDVRKVYTVTITMEAKTNLLQGSRSFVINQITTNSEYYTTTTSEWTKNNNASICKNSVNNSTFYVLSGKFTESKFNSIEIHIETNEFKKTSGIGRYHYYVNTPSPPTGWTLINNTTTSFKFEISNSGDITWKESDYTSA